MRLSFRYILLLILTLISLARPLNAADKRGSSMEASDRLMGSVDSSAFRTRQQASKLLAMTQAGYYSTQIGIDVRLNATCNSSLVVQCPIPNTAPSVVQTIPPQSTTVGQAFSFAISGGTFTDTETPDALTISVSGLPAGLTYTNGLISGTSSTTGTSTITVTATDPGGLSASTTFTITVSASATQPTSPATLTITSFSCNTTNSVLSSVDFVVGYSDGSFNPQVPDLFINGVTTSGQLGQPYTFGFDGNQSILPIQDQASRSTYFVWNFRQACNNGSVPPPAPTRPVVPRLPNQAAFQGTFFSYVVPAFSGTAPIAYTASGLPDGLSFDANTRTIAGTPTTVQTPTVTIAASNVAGQSNGTFTIAVSASATQPTGPATLTITSFSCHSTNAALSSVDFVVGYSDGTFTPVLSNLFINGVTITGQLGTQYSLSFDANQSELVIQDQTSRSTYFVWNFRKACTSRNVRMGVEDGQPWTAVVLGNPPVGEYAEIELHHAVGLSLHLSVVDLAGRVLSEQPVVTSESLQRVRVRVGQSPGGYLLRLRDQTRQQTLRVLRP